MTNPKPKRDTMIDNLKNRIIDLQEQLDQERKRSNLLQEELAFERMQQHGRVQRQSWGRPH